MCEGAPVHSTSQYHLPEDRHTVPVAFRQLASTIATAPSRLPLVKLKFVPFIMGLKVQKPPLILLVSVALIVLLVLILVGESMKLLFTLLLFVLMLFGHQLFLRPVVGSGDCGGVKFSKYRAALVTLRSDIYPLN